MAGDKAGLDGTKSSVVDHVFRLLRHDPVPWVLIENVYFMLHLAKGAAMERILGSLEELGYQWAYRVVDSRAFGLPQRRRRVFIVATTNGDPRDVLLADNVTPSARYPLDMTRPIAFYWTEGRSGNGLTTDATPPLKAGSSLGIPSPPAVLLPTGRVVTPPSKSSNVSRAFPPDGRLHCAAKLPATAGGWSAMPSPSPWPSGLATACPPPAPTIRPTIHPAIPENPGPRLLGTAETAGSPPTSRSFQSASVAAGCPLSTQTHGPNFRTVRCVASSVAPAKVASPTHPDSSTL